MAHTDPNGFVTTTVYDLAGRAVATVDALGYRTTTVYDQDGNVTALGRMCSTTADFLFVPFLMKGKGQVAGGQGEVLPRLRQETR